MTTTKQNPFSEAVDFSATKPSKIFSQHTKLQNTTGWVKSPYAHVQKGHSTTLEVR